MAQLRDTVVSGSLRATDTIYSTTAQFSILRAPTSSGGTTFGPGTNGQILKSNGTSIYWAADSDSHYTTHMYVNATAGGATSNANTANTTTYLHLYDNTTKRETIQIKGSGTTSVSSTGGVITINSADSKTGTVTSVQVQATSPVTSSTSTAQTGSLNTTIALADNYGDTKNPYASKTKNYVLAAGATANSAPSFRALVAADIPSLSTDKLTSGTLGVARGGTGAATAANARSNLGTWALISDSYNTLMPADGTTNTWIKIGTSNTSYGLLPSTSGGAGSGHNYIGTSSWYWKYAYIDQIYGYLNGNISGSSTSCSGNAATATRINGNLSAVNDSVGHNIWVSSTDSADGIPKYVSGVYVDLSGTITASGLTLSNPLSVANGGTGATTAANARSNLFPTNMPSTAKYFITIDDNYATGGYVTNARAAQIIQANASGTWGINITGNAATVSYASFGNASVGEHNANAIGANGLYYYTANGPTAAASGSESSDGGLFVQAYSASWVSQIASDYRTGQLWSRSFNNGSITTWKKVVMADENTTTLADCSYVKFTGIWTGPNLGSKPDDSTGWGSLFNIRLYPNDNNYHRQLYFDCYSTDKIWTRSCNGGTWTTWKQLMPQVTSLTTSTNSNGYINLNLSSIRYAVLSVKLASNIDNTNYYIEPFATRGVDGWGAYVRQAGTLQFKTLTNVTFKILYVDLGINGFA